MNKKNIKKYFTIILIIFFIKIINTTASEPQTKNINIRKPAVAGSFYPDEKKELFDMLKYFFDHTPTSIFTFTPKILISPHAGYIYSGAIASYGYKAIQNIPFKTIIILGPAHTEYFQGASIYSEGSYSTPLGNIEVDSALASAILKENSIFTSKTSSHVKEHSIEVQIPFLQFILKNFKIVPIVIGDIQDIANYKVIADAITKHIKNRDDVLIIASTDLSHYNSYEIAKKMDSIAIDGILRLDTDFLLRRNNGHECELCGFNPVMVSIEIAKSLDLNKTLLLNKANSGDTAGDKSRVVGYASILIGKEKEEEKKKKKMENSLSSEEKKELLKIARKTITSYVSEGKIPTFENITNPKLLVKQGAFVTIKKQHDLRGCIGNFISEKPLYRTIVDMAVAASSQDPRFLPMTKDELKDMSLEISVLSELKKIKDVKEIIVGTHGIYIMRGYYRGVLLPQVASEYGWDRDTFLQQTCFKASLPADAWMDSKTEIYIFSAQVFNEN